MSILKATVKKQDSFVWVTGNTAQQLVDNAFAAKRHIDKAETIKSYVTEYMNLYKENGAISKNTLIGYNSYLNNHILPPIGYKAINELTVNDVQQYINDKSSGLSKKTIKEHITLMAEIFDSAVEDGIINANPFRSKRLRIQGRMSKKILAYTEEEFAQLETVLPHLSSNDALYLALNLYCGLRRGEICALQWSDIDLENSTIIVSRSVSWPGQNKGIVKAPKTSNGVRTFVIISKLNSWFLKQNSRSGYLIRGRRGKENEPISLQGIKRLTERINKVLKNNGIDVRFENRVSRHTMATFMNNAGVDDKTIEYEMGHHAAAFTKSRYMNAQSKQIESSMSKLSDYITSINASE